MHSDKKTLKAHTVYLRWLLLLTITGGTIVFASHSTAAPAGPAGVGSGLQLWLSASEGAKTTGNVDATNGQGIAQWDDLSSASRNATPSSTQAVFSDTGLNYNPTLVFTNDNYTASNAGLPAGGTDRSIFVVASVNSGGWRYVLGAGTFGGGNGFDFGHNAGNQSVFITTHSSQEASTGSWNPYGAARLAYGAVSSASLYIAVNGSSPVIGSNPGGVNTVHDGSLNIGANSGGSELWDGNISEVIMYDRVVTPTERQRINSYLALKYGFSLDQSTAQSYLASGSNLMWDKDASGASTYNNGLFGIGRDDASGLSQVKSRGQTTTNVIILEANDEGTNTDPAFHDMADLEFLVIGDNNGAASWTTTGAPTGYSVLSRKWMKQEQGDVGSVSMSFDVADPDFNIPAALGDGQYYFIYDTNNNGSLSDETPQALTDLGSNLWKTNVDFGSGGLFTLAATDRPALNSMTPADNATGVGLNNNLVMNFSRAVSGDTGNLVIHKSSDDSVFETIPANSAKVTGNGSATITVNPAGTFAGSTEYYVTIEGDAFVDGSSNYFAGISNKQSWNFTTVSADVEGDGVDDAVEAGSPNDGDANDDSIADDTQAYVASLISSVTGNYVSLAVPNTCTLSNTTSKSETNLVADENYNYPLGLLDFSVACGSNGFTTTITQYYYNPPSGDFVLRKYVNGSYQTVSDATITRSTIGGQPVLLVQYQATDGGALDDDGIANGTIVDPAGPAVLASTTTTTSSNSSAPNTGLEQKNTVIFVFALGIGTVLLGLHFVSVRSQTSAAQHR